MTVIVHPLVLGQGKVKVLIKDSIDIENTVTQAGSRALEDSPQASQNAEVVERILQQDGLILGKTNLHELAFGITGINHYTGTPINPLYPDLIPGGSSSGSAAAVAAGLCDFAVGTDTGGSIRMPAACCGVFGLKPTFSRISRKGVLPAHSSLDCVGPLAADMPRLIQAMHMIDPLFDLTKAVDIDFDHLKVMLLDVVAEQQIWQSIDAFLKRAGVQEYSSTAPRYIGEAFDAAMHIINYENYQAFSHLISSGKLGADVEQRLKNAVNSSEQHRDQAQELGRLFCQEIDQLLEQADVLILPTLPQQVPTLSQVEQAHNLLQLTALVRPFNLSGHPALSLPLQTEQGQPVGLQIIAKHGQDEKLCLIAKYLVEQANKPAEQ